MADSNAAYMPPMTTTTTVPTTSTTSITMTAGSNGPAGSIDGVVDNSFGDLLAELLRTLPSDASPLFLRSLSGLSPSESHDFCEYVAKLKPEKQFRVIHAMCDSTLDGKRKFLSNLAKKMEQQTRKQQAIDEQAKEDMEAYIKRKEALIAADRVKKMNAGANKFHSFNAAVGAGVVATKENLANGVNVGGDVSPVAPVTVSDRAVPSSPGDGNGSSSIGRSMSSSSVTVSKEDIKQVGTLLGMAHITASEMNLRELEITKKAFVKTTGSGNENEEMVDPSKRDRPESSRELIHQEEKPAQRTRPRKTSDDDEDEDEQSGTYYQSSSSVGGNDRSEDDVSSPTGEYEDPDAPSTKRWTKLQDNALRESVRIHGEKNWKAIAELVPGRNHAQCLQRWRKVLKPGLVKGHWSFEEDQVLEYLVTQGCNNWGQIAERIPGRTPKQCRERWKNHLDPAINKGPYTEEEDTIILEAQARLGNKWSQIAQLLKGRTEDSVKIRWKSLKQNPAKAAASHAQQKKAQQQQHHHHHPQQASPSHPRGSQQPSLHPAQSQPSPSSATMGYQQSNPALLRQRQLQLMQQQQQLQHTEAAQLEHHQQLQQQHLQLRLQERLLHQQQLQRQQLHGPSSIDLSTMKTEPELTATGMLGLPGGALNLGSGVPISLPSARAGSHMFAQGGSFGSGFLPGQDDSKNGSFNSYDFHVPTTSADASTAPPAPTATSSFGFLPAMSGMHHMSHAQLHHNETSPVPHHHHSRESSDGSWNMNGELVDDGFTRLGENPPPASFWDNYPKHAGLLPEPIPLSTQQGHNSIGTSLSSHFAVPGDDAYDEDAMFEKLATELGSNTLHFAPI